MSTAIADILERAADRVALGWVQHRMDGEDGAVCALRALEMNGGDLGTPAYSAFIKHVGIEYGRVGAWNDAPGRTQAEVVTVLRKAAQIAREKETT